MVQPFRGPLLVHTEPELTLTNAPNSTVPGTETWSLQVVLNQLQFSTDNTPLLTLQPDGTVPAQRLSGDGSALAVADGVSLQNALSAKVDTATFNTALDTKVDATTFNAGLANKVDTATFNAALDNKVDTATFNDELDDKVDTVTFNTELGLKFMTSGRAGGLKDSEPLKAVEALAA